MATQLTTGDVVLKHLQGKKTDVPSILFQVVLLVSLLLSLLVLMTLLVDIFRDGWGVIADRGMDFIRAPLSSLPTAAGVWQGIVGSALLALVVVAVAFPIGIGAAVYLEEYARDSRLTRFITVNIRNLAGVPSVVYGLLGLAIFAKALGAITGPEVEGRSLLTGGLTLAILVLPIVIITTSEALRAVPSGIREAGYGVGATRWEVIRSHVLPAATPGILTGMVLSLSRALGETAPLILVGAVTGFLATGAQSIAEQFQGRFTALPMIIFNWARQPNVGFRALTAAAIIVLLAFILTANAAAIYLRNRYERKW
jgi:phosphate transport system permease protein